MVAHAIRQPAPALLFCLIASCTWAGLVQISRPIALSESQRASDHDRLRRVMRRVPFC